MKNRIIPLPTFKEFTQLNNWWRKIQKKEKQHKVILALYYPFAIIVLFVCVFFFLMFMDRVRSSG